jgi:hypothetical protein
VTFAEHSPSRAPALEDAKEERDHEHRRGDNESEPPEKDVPPHKASLQLTKLRIAPVPAGTLFAHVRKRIPLVQSVCIEEHWPTSAASHRKR